MILITSISHRRSMILFKESIKSKYTKMNYTSHLNQFKKFTGVSCEDQWLIIPQKDLQIMLEDYIMHLRHTTSPNSIPSKFRGIIVCCITLSAMPRWLSGDRYLVHAI